MCDVFYPFHFGIPAKYDRCYGYEWQFNINFDCDCAIFKTEPHRQCTQKKCLIVDSFYFVTETLTIIIIPRDRINGNEFKRIFYM